MKVAKQWALKKLTPQGTDPATKSYPEVDLALNFQRRADLFCTASKNALNGLLRCVLRAAKEGNLTRCHVDILRENLKLRLGNRPAHALDPEKGEEARKLYDDAHAMLEKVIAEKWLRAAAVIGLFPANAVGDDIRVYADEERSEPIASFHCLRKQGRQPAGKANECLADFVAPEHTGLADYIGGFACTAGIGIDGWVAGFEKDHDDYSALMLKAIADRLAEALAEMLHERVRKRHWGYAEQEDLDNEQLIEERYQGIRPAMGYPASPDHTAISVASVPYTSG